MYGDQSGEFVCGYWGLKGLGSSVPFSVMRDSGYLFYGNIVVVALIYF